MVTVLPTPPEPGEKRSDNRGRKFTGINSNLVFINSKWLPITNQCHFRIIITIQVTRNDMRIIMLCYIISSGKGNSSVTGVFEYRYHRVLCMVYSQVQFAIAIKIIDRNILGIFTAPRSLGAANETAVVLVFFKITIVLPGVGNPEWVTAISTLLSPPKSPTATPWGD